MYSDASNKLFTSIRDYYQKGTFDKEILKALTGNRIPGNTQVITEEEYKIITGEEWTSPIF